MEAGDLEAYILHRLRIVGWQGRPRFDVSAFDALDRHTGGIPRRVNQLASRLLLFAAREQLETIGAEAVETVVADMASDSPRPVRREEPVLPLRASADSSPEPAPQPAQPAHDLALERRVADLEARLEEQENAIRRVLTLLVDWVENGQGPPDYRHRAA